LHGNHRRLGMTRRSPRPIPPPSSSAFGVHNRNERRRLAAPSPGLAASKTIPPQGRAGIWLHAMTSSAWLAAQELRNSLQMLRTKRFGTFWVASLLSSIGTWAQQVAEPWLLLTLGASPFVVGLDSFALNAPVLALTVAGGVLADRSDRRRVIATFQSVQMLCPVTLVVLLLVHAVHPLVVIALSLVVGITDALSMPSFQSIVPSIVPREQIARGLALNSTQFNLSRIVGPAIAGALMATVGPVACFALNAASYVPFIGVALWILPPRPATAVRSAQDRGPPLAGLGDVLASPLLRGALLTVLTTSVLSAQLVTFTPVLVRDALGGGSSQYSAAVVAFGIGGLLGAFLLLAVPSGSDQRRWSSRAAVVYGLAVTLSAALHSQRALPVVMVVAGTSMAITNISANSLLQAAADRRLLGRSVGMFMLSMRGGLSLGAVLSGVAVHALGVRAALSIDGVAAVLFQLVIGRSWTRATFDPAR